jgi:hypothetical protein
VKESVSIEVVGYKHSECSPFPCDQDRSCGLEACSPSNHLLPAVEALREKIREEFGDQVDVHLVLLDSGVPDYIRTIYEEQHPAIPMILINRELVPVGRISYGPIRDAVLKRLPAV